MIASLSYNILLKQMCEQKQTLFRINFNMEHLITHIILCQNHEEVFIIDMLTKE